MANLTREAILAANDLPTEVVSVPEWGGEVIVRGMRGIDRDAFETALFKGEGDEKRFSPENIRARLVAACAVDDKGAPLFTTDDVAALGQRSAIALDRVYDVAQRLSGIGKKELETAVKN